MEQNKIAESEGNNLFFVLLCVYYFLCTIMPVVSQIINAHIFMAVIVIIYMLIIFECDDFIDFIFPVVFLTILKIFDAYARDTNEIALFIYQQMIILIPVCICYFLLKKNRKELIKKFIILICFVFVVTSITSAFGLLKDPMAARVLATIQNSKSDEAVNLNMKNIGGYDIVYSTVLMYPMIICLYKYKKLSKIIMILITGCFAVYLFLAQYTTAIILFCINLLLLVIPDKLSTKTMKKLGIFALILFVVVKPLVAKLFGFFSHIVASVTLSERFQVISDFLNGIESTNDSTIRIKLYQASIDRFLRNPLFGNLFSDNVLGGHSFMLDTAAQFGVIGIILLIIMYRQIYIKLYRPFKKNEYYGYMIFVFIETLILSAIDTGQFLFTLCLFTPAIGYILQQQHYKSIREGAVLYEDNVDN